MDNDATNPTIEQISDLPLESRAAAFSELEREIRQRLDEQPR